MWHWEGVLAIPTELISKDLRSLQHYRPETAWLGSSSAQMDRGILADSRLNVSQQLALAIKKASSILGCISGITASRSRKVIASFCSACVRLHLEHYVQFWAPNIRKMLINCKFSRRPPQWHGLEHLPLEERLKELGWEKRWFWGHLTAACPYLWEGYREDGARLFTVVHGRRMMDGGRKLKQQRFRLVTRKSFFNIRTIKF